MITEEEKEILRKAEEIRRKQELDAIEAGDDYGSRYRVPGSYHVPRQEEASYTEDAPQDAYPAYVVPPAEVPYGTEFPPEEPEPPVKEKKRRHIFGKIVLVLMLLVIAAVLFIFLQAGKAAYMPYDAIQEDPGWGLPKAREKGVLNVLLIGTDARVSDNDCRADSIILMSVCPQQRKIWLTSILRDCYVTIPDIGMNRINHAYQMGNARMLVQTVEMNLHVRIDRYIRVDFYSFAEIIDAFGGVDIFVTGEEVHWVNAYLSEINHLMDIDPYDSQITEGGLLHLNGRQALAYSRIRYIGTDFGRTSRQRTVLQALSARAKKNPLGVLFASGKIYGALTTDMTCLELTALTLRTPFLMGYRVETGQIPYDGTWWNDSMGAGGEVLGLDLGANTAILRKNIYGE